MATAEKPKGKPQLPQGNLDDIDDSKTEYSPGSKADQTIQPGSLQAELQKVVHPGGSAKDRKGASNLESEKSSSQQETKDAETKRVQNPVHEETDLSFEEPILREERSDDEDTESLITMDPSLLDPEMDKSTPVFTLAKIFPRIQIKREDLDKDPELHTKCVNMYDISGGQKRSYTVGMKNLTGAITFLKEAVEAKNKIELELQKEAVRRAEIEAEKAQSQIRALREARDARQTANSGQESPTVHRSMPNGSRHECPDKRSDPPNEPAGRNATPRRNASTFFTRSARFNGGNGGGRGGGHYPNEGRRPPFVPDEDEEEERDPATTLIKQLTKALQNLQPNKPNAPDYRGIEKPKLDIFSGDASVYAHWKKKFLLLHGPERNLNNAYLANALHCLLKGEARRKVEVHFTADWDGENYQRMWDTLDSHYGSKHIQDRCIQDRAARIIPLEQETLNTVSTFCDEITVQINYYLVHQPAAVNDDNTHLYQQMRRKMSDKIFLKFAEWTHGRSDEDEELPPRSLLRLQKWLQMRTTLLRETEVFSSSAKHKASKSPRQESFTSQTDLGDSSAQRSGS